LAIAVGVFSIWPRCRTSPRRPASAIATEIVALCTSNPTNALMLLIVSLPADQTSWSAQNCAMAQNEKAMPSGRRPPTAPWRSRPPNSVTYWRGSIGVIHREPGTRMRQGDSVRGAGRSEEARIGSPGGMTSSADALLDDIEALKRLVLARETELA
jgi:hypothetical protein